MSAEPAGLPGGEFARKGDAFAHAVATAPKAGVLVHVARSDCAELAVVVEPDEPLRTARRTF
jgi:hypothetical protein